MPNTVKKVSDDNVWTARAESTGRKSRYFVWKKHGRKKMVGYCVALDLEVAIVRVPSGPAPIPSAGYMVESKMGGKAFNIGEKFPKFAESLKGEHPNFASAWHYFARAFDDFAHRLLTAILEAKKAEQPAQEEAVQP